MTVNTIPEEIVPGNLVMQDGEDFTSVVSAALPNGDDALRITSGTGSNKQNAYQDVIAGSHMMNLSGPNAVSFWIRRLQSFNPADVGFLSGGSTGDPESMMFGVGVANGTDIHPANNHVGWLVRPSSASAIQIGFAGENNYNNCFWWSTAVTLTTDTWHHVVFQTDSGYFDTAEANGTMVIESYIDAVKYTAAASNSAVGRYEISPDRNMAADLRRFSIGDPTTADQATRGAADGPLYDIAHLSFHSAALTIAEIYGLGEAMRYGG